MVLCGFWTTTEHPTTSTEKPVTLSITPNVDNVHFGPAGIGLLIMGFLVLGCKCFNPTFDMCLSNNMAKEIKQPTCSVYVSASIA
jgi:hypothetical protein